MTMLGRHLLETGQLRQGIGLDEVRDVLWNYLAIDELQTARPEPRLATERYSRWLAVPSRCPAHKPARAGRLQALFWRC